MRSAPGTRRGSLPSRLTDAARALPRLGSLSAYSAFGVRIGAAGLAYLLQIVLARSLGAAEYGTFSFAWSIVTIGGFLATLGFGQIAVRFLAQYHASHAHGLARGFIRTGLAATLLGSLAAAVAILAFHPLVERGYGPLCATILMIGIAALPFFALSDFLEGIARSQGWTIRALAPPYIVRQSVTMLLLLIAVMSGIRAHAELAMLAAFTGTAAAACLHVVLVARPARGIFPRAKPEYDLGLWRGAALPTLLSDCALLARQNLDLIILGLVAPPQAVGLYFAASRIASLLGLIEFAVGAGFGHRFARVAQTDGAFAPLFGEARRLTAIGGMIGGLTIAMALPVILKLFGAEFAGAIPATTILLAAATIRLLLGPVEDLLAMAGHPESVWRANAAGALVLAALCLLLARDAQATGAAIAAAGGSLAAAAILAVAVRRHLGFWPMARW